MQRFLSERVSTTPSTPPTPAVFIQCRLLSNGKRLQHTLRTPTHVIHLQLRCLFIREASTPPCSTPPHYLIVYHSSCAFAHRRSLWTPNRCDRCICQWCFFSDWGFRSPSLLPLLPLPLSAPPPLVCVGPTSCSFPHGLSFFDRKVAAAQSWATK